MSTLFYGRGVVYGLSVLPANPQDFYMKNFRSMVSGLECYFVIEFHVTKKVTEAMGCLLNVNSLKRCTKTHAVYVMVSQKCTDQRSWPISVERVQSHLKFKKLKADLVTLGRENLDLEKELGNALRDNKVLEDENFKLSKGFSAANQCKRNTQAENSRLSEEKNVLLLENARLKDENAALRDDYSLL